MQIIEAFARRFQFVSRENASDFQSHWSLRTMWGYLPLDSFSSFEQYFKIIVGTLKLLV